jgi:hypothetical protein
MNELDMAVWTIEDVKTLRPKWSDARCHEFLAAHEPDIQEVLIARGWDCLADLLAQED